MITLPLKNQQPMIASESRKQAVIRCKKYGPHAEGIFELSTFQKIRWLELKLTGIDSSISDKMIYDGSEEFNYCSDDRIRALDTHLERLTGDQGGDHVFRLVRRGYPSDPNVKGHFDLMELLICIPKKGLTVSRFKGSPKYRGVASKTHSEAGQELTKKSLAKIVKTCDLLVVDQPYTIDLPQMFIEGPLTKVRNPKLSRIRLAELAKHGILRTRLPARAFLDDRDSDLFLL